MRTISFKEYELAKGSEETDHPELENVAIGESTNFMNSKLAKLKLQANASIFEKQLMDSKNLDFLEDKDGYDHEDFVQKENNDQLDVAATKLQKVYKRYRTADYAVFVEELWWKELDSAALRRSSVSFFNAEKSETAASKWKRARIRAAKVGKGLSRNEKAQKLHLRHWLEAIDPRHRYGHNLHLYYDVWVESESNQPFFYWLDIGDGKEVNLDKCPRTDLQHQCIKYLGPKEREAYEVVIENGKLVYKKARVFVDTPEGSKWIFVLSTSRSLYVGEKKKGLFQHSSFLSGGATIASGRLVARHGILEAMWPFSGHYRPTEENFMEFCSFLEDHHVDLTNIKKFPIDEDIPPKVTGNEEVKSGSMTVTDNENNSSAQSHEAIDDDNETYIGHSNGEEKLKKSSSEKEASTGFELKKLQSWSKGAGPRIHRVRDYPTRLQFHALKQVNLSPRSIMVNPGPFPSCINGHVPSPKPTPKFHLSPRLTFIELSSPNNINVYLKDT